MTYAAYFSRALVGFKAVQRVVALLNRYHLPTFAEFDRHDAFEVLQKDKKKVKHEMNYILLSRIGKGIVFQITLENLKKMILSI